MSRSLCSPWGHGLNGELNADWLTRRLITDWLSRMRICKQIPCGCHDVIRFERILGDTPLEYISRANILN